MFFQNFIQTGEWLTGTNGINDFLLSFQHDVINQFLPFCEFSVHREGAGNIPIIPIYLCAAVHQQQIAVFGLAIVFGVVEDGTYFPSGSNGLECLFPCAVLHEGEIKMGFDFIFHHTGTGICHHGFHTHTGNIHGFPHFFQFVRLFDETQVTKNGVQIPHSHGRVFFPQFFGKTQCRCQHIIPFPMFQIQIDFCDVVAEHHLCKIIGECVNGANICHAADFFRFFRSHVCPYPFGKDTVISGNEQGFLQTACHFCHEEHAIFPFHPCHIVKVAVRRKRIILISSFQGCFSCKKYSGAAFFQSGCQFSSVIYKKSFCHVICLL